MTAHRLPSSVACLFALTAAVVATHALPAQATSGAQHFSSRRNLVRFDDTLYLLGITTTGEVDLWRNHEGATNWSQVAISGGINDTSTGIGTSFPTNVAALAVTADGVLHVTWARSSYPTFFEQYYRAIDPVAGTSVTNILNVTSAAGATTATRTDSVDIAAGAGAAAVYLTAQGPANWINRLLRIDRLPSGWPAAPLPVDLGILSTSASSQQARLAVAANGVVHAAFYNNGGSGDFVHRSWDGSNWSVQTILGDGIVRRDLAGDISADPLGVVHAVYNHWLSATQSEVRYRTLIAGAWSSEILVHAPAAGIDLDNLISLSTDVFGDAFAVYFNDVGDAVYRLGHAGVFGAEVLLLPSGIAAPTFPPTRGSLFPESNRNHCELDIVHIWTPSVPTQLYHQRQSTCTCGTVAVGYSGSWAPGTNGNVDLSGAAPSHFGIAVLGVDLLPLPVPVLGCPCPLFVRPDALGLVIVGANGQGQVQIPVPLAAVGTTLWAQWLTLDPSLTVCNSSPYAARYVP